jgi:16S rRNA (cytosine967-C5)-methyltransferase
MNDRTEHHGDKTPLWRQLQSTARVVQAVQQGRSGTAALDEVASGLRAAVQALSFHVWRNLGRATALRQQLARRRPPPAADALLTVALALAWDEAQAPYDSFTLVNQAVEAAKKDPPTRPQASFINACLRRFLRERDTLVALTAQDPVALWNHPMWWIERVQQDHPEHWQSMLKAANQQAPLTLRVNARHSTVAGYQQVLSEAGLQGTQVGPWAIALDTAVPVHSLPGFAQGHVSVQDAAAQWAAPLLLEGREWHAGLRVLDACAAPGGKTGHLLELADAQVTALEVDAQRAKRIGENLVRLGLQAQVCTADASRPESWWDGTPFDAILLDAPCTASGIVRRHPDVRWLRRETDVAALAAQQHAMLSALWPLLRPGGRLLFCTCSVFRAEGKDQVQTFLAHNTDAQLLPSPGHLLPQSHAKERPVPDNAPIDHDGFFYALLQKHAPA